jgi:hypothetical protein
MGAGAADWRNKAIAPYKCAQIRQPRGRCMAPAPHPRRSLFWNCIFNATALREMHFCRVAWGSIKGRARCTLRPHTLTAFSAKRGLEALALGGHGVGNISVEEIK